MHLDLLLIIIFHAVIIIIMIIIVDLPQNVLISYYTKFKHGQNRLKETGCRRLSRLFVNGKPLNDDRKCLTEFQTDTTSDLVT